jgi:hypothetical protein
MKQIQAIAASYLRSSIAGALAVYMTGNTNPKDLALGLVAGIVPVLARWANPKDSTFGVKRN